MLFTFADLELRRKAETALRQSEARFAKAFRLTPVPTVLARAKSFHVTGINEAFTRVFGPGKDKVAGRSLAEAGLWVNDRQRVNVEVVLEIVWGRGNGFPLQLGGTNCPYYQYDCLIEGDCLLDISNPAQGFSIRTDRP